MQGWKQDTFHLRVFVIRFVCCAGEVGSSPVWRPAVKPPLGLAETAECGWCESGLRLAIAKASGVQLWTLWGGCVPTRTHSQVTARGEFVCFAVVQLMAFLPITRKRTAFKLISCYEGLGWALSPHSAEMSGFWDRTRLQYDLPQRNVVSVSVRLGQFCSEWACQVETIVRG